MSIQGQNQSRVDGRLYSKVLDRGVMAHRMMLQGSFMQNSLMHSKDITLGQGVTNKWVAMQGFQSQQPCPRETKLQSPTLTRKWE